MCILESLFCTASKWLTTRQREFRPIHLYGVRKSFQPIFEAISCRVAVLEFYGSRIGLWKHNYRVLCAIDSLDQSFVCVCVCLSVRTITFEWNDLDILIHLDRGLLFMPVRWSRLLVKFQGHVGKFTGWKHFRLWMHVTSWDKSTFGWKADLNWKF